MIFKFPHVPVKEVIEPIVPTETELSSYSKMQRNFRKQRMLEDIQKKRETAEILESEEMDGKLKELRRLEQAYSQLDGVMDEHLDETKQPWFDIPRMEELKRELGEVRQREYSFFERKW